jgi:hypothetical protein
VLVFFALDGVAAFGTALIEGFVTFVTALATTGVFVCFLTVVVFEAAL